MKLFNAFQLVAVFVALPYLMGWLQDATFRGSAAAFYATAALYVVAFACMVACVWRSLDDSSK